MAPSPRRAVEIGPSGAVAVAAVAPSPAARVGGPAVAAPAIPAGILSPRARGDAGWCACGPRARYAAAVGGRGHLLEGRPRADDHRVWLVACVVVAPAHRGRGVTGALVRAAVDLARAHGAAAVEGWPLAAGAGRSADAFLGREEVFAAAGFRCVDRPAPQRAVMRLDLAGRAAAG